MSGQHISDPGFEVKELPDGTLEIARYLGSETDLVIPERIGGRPVTAIGSLGSDCSAAPLTSLHLPATVTDIRCDAEPFSALQVCRFLRSITVSPDNPRFTAVDGVLFDRSMKTLLFYPPEKESGFYRIPDGVEEIGRFAFWGCDNLFEVTFPASVIVLGEEAFGACANLSGVTIPAQVFGIEGVFNDCPALEAFHVSPDHPEIIEVDGILFDRARTTLLAYPCGRGDEEYAVPQGVREIGGHAFSGCPALTRIVLPDTVACIREKAFADCTALEEIVIPQGVRELPAGTFSGCSALCFVRLPDSVTVIGDHAFNSCNVLPGIALPTRLTHLGTGAFNGCHHLTGLELPASLVQMGDNPFCHCSRLYSLTAAPDNARYEVRDGVLFDTRDHALVSYPVPRPGDTYVIPPDIQAIGPRAFFFPSQLRSIAVPATVTRFGRHAVVPPQTLVVEPGSPAEAHCRTAGIAFRYADRAGQTPRLPGDPGARSPLPPN